jgi:hypothetical protein
MHTVPTSQRTARRAGDPGGGDAVGRPEIRRASGHLLAVSACTAPQRDSDRETSNTALTSLASHGRKEK